MPVETVKLNFTPLGGVDYEDNATRLASNLVSASTNFMYQGQQCLTRPGLAPPPDASFSFINHPVTFADKVYNNAVGFSMFVDTFNNIYYYAAGTGSGAVAGSGAVFANHVFINVTSVIGQIVFGGNPGGIITWDPTTLTNVYVIQTTAPYRYVSALQGRAIAAYNTTESMLLGPRAFAYSKPGSLSIWTSTDGSAGEINISDIEDDITGLGVLHNIVVIPHRNGIHIGYPTGALPLPFDIQPFIRWGGGIWQPSTVAFSDEVMFGVGEDNVFMFDLNTLSPIGNPIRNELLTNINDGTLYRGFITRFGYDTLPARLRYHLVPLGNNSCRQFTYDFVAQSWAPHEYNSAGTINWAWAMPSTASIGNGDYGIALVDNAAPPDVNIWQSTVPCEQPSTVTRYCGVIDDLASDYMLEDVILHYQDNLASAVDVTITIQGTLAGAVTTTDQTTAIGGLNDGLWKRAQMGRGSNNLRQLGNDFFLTLSVPANSSLTFDQVTVLLTRQGDFRG
jgi:hypothetical protein